MSSTLTTLLSFALPFSGAEPGEVGGHRGIAFREVSLPASVLTEIGAGRAARWAGMQLPDGEMITLVLGPIAGYAPDATLELVQDRDPDGALPATPRTVTLDPNTHAPITAMAGVVDGVPDSHAFVGHAQLPDGRVMLNGYIEASGRRWIISSGPVSADGAAQQPIVFEPAALPTGIVPPSNFRCEVLAAIDGAGGGLPDGGLAGGVGACRQMRVAVETDVEFLANRFAGNTYAATAYVGMLYAAMNEIYQRDVQIHPWVGYLRLWETDIDSDPYTLEVGDRLGQFRNHWESTMSSVARHEAHILCGIGGGGVAWIPSICNSYSYAASCVGGSFPYPLVHNDWGNWDVMVVAHEMGHNCGGPHTHDSDPIIDGCGSNPQDCTAADLDIGTIMSYCHICEGGMSNIRLEFAPGSIGYIGNYIASLNCGLEGDGAAPAAVNDQALSLLGQGPIDLDILANDIPVNCSAVSLAQYQTGTPTGGQVSIVIGGGPDGRPLLRYTPAAGFSGTDSFVYQVSEAGGSQLGAGTVFITIREPWVPTAPIGDKVGLNAAYYQGSWGALPDWSQLVPYLNLWVGALGYQSTGGNFANSGIADNVGAVYTGWVNVPQTGWWSLSTESDDGSALWIDGVRVVNNDGVHGMQKIAGTVPLGAGKHAVKVEFFEAGGGAGLIMRWQGPGSGVGGDGSEQIVPASRLTRGGAPRPGDVNADTLVNGTDLSILLARWGLPGQGDLDGSGAVDGADLGALLGGWTG